MLGKLKRMRSRCWKKSRDPTYYLKAHRKSIFCKCLSDKTSRV